MNKTLMALFVILILSVGVFLVVGGGLDNLMIVGNGNLENIENEDRIAQQPERCYVGGCSGELCTNSPDAIGTCEFLPGMKCLSKEMSCELVDGQCSWVLSEDAARCFLAVEEEHGRTATQTRIENLFEKARAFSN